MKGIDDLLDCALQHAKRLEEFFLKGAPQPDKELEKRRLLSSFKDALVNLKRFEEVSSDYLAGRFDVILTKQYAREDYED